MNLAPARRLLAGIATLAAAVFAANALWSGAMITGAIAAPADRSIVLLQSASTRRFLEANASDYDAMLMPWRDFASRHAITLAPANFERLMTLGDGAVAIVPGASALTDTERQQLREAAARGVSLLATGAIATRDATGRWLGYELMKELFDAQVVGQIDADSNQRFLQIIGQSPVSPRHAPLQRLFLARSTQPLLLAVAGYPVARYSDWTRSLHGPTLARAAASIAQRGNSRRVWIGFPETSWAAARDDIDLLLLDSLNWMQKKPAAVLANWPAPFESAFVLEMDSEFKFANTTAFAAELNKRGMRGTFYCVSSDAVKHPDLVRRLAQKHEIAYHGDEHTSFRGEPIDQQTKRVQNMKAQLAPLLAAGEPATGFRAPLEEFDQVTERVLRANGIRHLASSPNATDSALPRFSTAEPELSSLDALVVLPRTMVDDLNLLALNETQIASVPTLLNSANTIISGHGFGLLSLHTQHFDAGSAMQRDVVKLLDVLQQQKDLVWIASGNQIERWWRDKSRTVASVVQNGSTLDIDLTVSAPDAVRNAQIIVIAPEPNKAPTIRSPIAYTVRALDPYRFAIAFATINPGSHRIWVGF